ncbi:MAG: hypothetical protein KAR05_08670 [Candidatus Omnitrophica bacterium]|nr:hypothetical protein [Candidatus Omnitrophota bacterium]
MVVVSPEEGYGPVDPRAVVEIPKTNLAPDMTPEKGMMLQMQTQNGQALPGIIEEVKAEVVVVNFNHPLAGEELKFDVKIAEIK